MEDFSIVRIFMDSLGVKHTDYERVHDTLRNADALLMERVASAEKTDREFYLVRHSTGIIRHIQL